MKRHLHRDYGTSFCGKDASHILMTFDESETDCASCKHGLEAHREREAEQAEARMQKAAREKELEEREQAALAEQRAAADRERKEMAQRLARLERAFFANR